MSKHMLSNSYIDLPDTLYSFINPEPVQSPSLVIFNDALADELGIDEKEFGLDILAGNKTPENVRAIAQAYAGHQFAHFTMLGDGRAHLLGEHVTDQGVRYDIQLKGSGRTPYSRRGDGRAALGPMLREYIISEAMAALNIPTSRSLAVVSTGEAVMRDSELPGAILTRVASSHIRVGTFEFAAEQSDVSHVRAFTDYTIKRHYPHLLNEEMDEHERVQQFLLSVIERQISLITEWMRVGFIHGVMNTDNMLISGETIDYGPCAFMEAYDPNTVFSSIDRYGRYAFANQAPIAQWNLARFAETLLPLLHHNERKAIAFAEQAIEDFGKQFQTSWHKMMARKIGLSPSAESEKLIKNLLAWMQEHKADYTNMFRDLCYLDMPQDSFYQNDGFKAWWSQWQALLEKDDKQAAQRLMQNANPCVIPRNHKVEEALDAAEQSFDFKPLHAVLQAIQAPYEDHERQGLLKAPAKEHEKVRATFCGT